MDMTLYALLMNKIKALASGISNIVPIGNGLRFTTLSGTNIDVTLPTHTHSNLANILEKFTLDGSNNLLFDGQPIKSNIDLTPYLKTVDADAKYELKDGTIVKDASYVHTDNNYTNSEKSKLASLNNFSKDYNDLINQPIIPSITGLATQFYVDSKDNLKADKVHNHVISDITNLQSSLDNKVDEVANMSLVNDSDIAKLQAITGTNTGDETNSSIKAKMGQSSTSQDGYLTSVDWNTFNNKQNKIFIQNTQPTIATNNIWVDNTTNPYVLKVCDGNSYIQVGNSASGSVQEIVIQSTQPSDTTIKLWLDTSSSPILKWYKGSSWVSVGSSSGHVIQDSTITFSQRKNLKFTGAITITDSPTDDTTIIDVKKNLSSPVEPKEDIALANGQDTYEVISHTVGSKYMFVLVDGVRIPYADYDDIDSTHIKLKPNIAIDVKKDMVITSYSTVIETVLINDTTLNGGTF